MCALRHVRSGQCSLRLRWLCAPGGRDSGGLASQGSGLLHAQSSTIMLPTGHEGSDADDMFDAEEDGDAMSFFSAQSHLGGGGSSLPRFSDLPASAQTSTLDLLLITGRHAPAGGAARPSGMGGASPGGTRDYSSQAAAVGFTTTAQAAARMQLQHSSVLCSDILVRLYTEGWGVAAACWKQYAAAAAAPASGGGGAGHCDADPPRQPPRDAAGPTHRIECSTWLIEVVATGGTGATAPSGSAAPASSQASGVHLTMPACCQGACHASRTELQVAHDMSSRIAQTCGGSDAGSSREVPSVSLEGTAWARLQGGRLLQARLPALLLRCSLVDPDYDIGVSATARELGALLGVADVALTMPGVLPLALPGCESADTCAHSFVGLRE